MNFVKILLSYSLCLFIASCNSGGGTNISSTNLNPVIKTQYIYFVSSNSNYTKCPLIQNMIESSTCITESPSAPGALNQTQAVTFSKNYAYFLNNNTSYTQCQVGISGIESDTCQTESPTNFITDATNGTGVATDGHFIYFQAATGTNIITQCQIIESGINPDSCTYKSIGTITTPPTAQGIGIYGNTLYSAIANDDFLTFISCSLSPTTGINTESCQFNTDIEITNDDNNALAISNNFIIFANETNYSKCLISESGIDINSCINVIGEGELSFTNVSGVAINNNYVYFAEANDYIQCNTDQYGIILGSCIKTRLVDANNNSILNNITDLKIN
jgi:hypothetical protein